MTPEQLTADLAASRAMVIALQIKLTEALEKIAELSKR
jgi:hypothetical protein